MVRRNFKQTEIGELPEEWEVVAFSQTFEFIKGKAPSDFSDSEKSGYAPYLSTDYLRDNLIGKYVRVDERIVLAETGDVILLWDGSNAGEFFLGKNGVLSSTMVKIKTKNGKYDIQFLFYLLKQRENFLKSQTKGTGIPHVDSSVLNNIILICPPLPEQRKISEVLTAVDNAIQKVDEAIVKTERIKQGLMDTLLTRGIGHRKFKKTEIGELPEEWEITTVGDGIENVKNGFASGARDDNGVVQIRMNNVTTDGRFKFKSYLKVPIPERIDEFLLKKDDFLFNNTNSLELVGKSVLVKELPFPCVFSNHFTRIRFNTKKLSPEFMLYYIISLWQKGYFRSVSIRHVGQVDVNPKYLINKQMATPSLAEQRKIAEILMTVDQKLELQRKRKERLERIKHGLMDELLTGKKRVVS